jgi:hypothetical protein
MDFFIRVLVEICLASKEAGVQNRVTIHKKILFELINIDSVHTVIFLYSIRMVHFLEAGSYSLSMFHNPLCGTRSFMRHIFVLLLITTFYKFVYRYDLVQVHTDKVCV